MNYILVTLMIGATANMDVRVVGGYKKWSNKTIYTCKTQRWSRCVIESLLVLSNKKLKSILSLILTDVFNELPCLAIAERTAELLK